MKTKLNEITMGDVYNADDKILLMCYDIVKNELKKRKLVRVYLESRKKPSKVSGGRK